LGLKEPFRKTALLQELADDGHRVRGADMQGGNFWGVINHDNEEGIIRIATIRSRRVEM